MLPPSDSFLHQSLKLAEVTANMQNQETLAQPPPPPYSATQQPYSASQDETPHNDIDIDAEDDETTWDTPSPNPVTINIDASISVQGNSNTIIMASGGGAAPSLKRTESGPVPVPVPVPIPSPSSSLSPRSSSPEQQQPGTPSATEVLQAAQKHRQAKLTDMATAIIAALRGSQDSPLGGEEMGPVPIGININTGVKIEGSKNVICAGGGAGRVLSRKRDAQNTMTTTTNDNRNGGGLDENLKRKRRAQSVCLHRLLYLTLLIWITNEFNFRNLVIHPGPSGTACRRAPRNEQTPPSSV